MTHPSVNIQYHNHNFKLYTHGFDDQVISSHIEKYGAWEKELTDIWYNHINEGDLVLDIGANIGWYTKIANIKGAVAISVEPDPKNFSLLQQNCSNYTNEFYNLCVGNNTDDIMLKLSNDNYGDNRTGVDGDILCKQTTIDNLVGDRANKIRAIKIDTQGWEPNIILGGLETLKNVADDCVIIIEYWPWGLSQNNFNYDAYINLRSIFTGSLTHFPNAVDWETSKDNPHVHCDLIIYKGI
jgi:FkbM family methyltransferase